MLKGGATSSTADRPASFQSARPSPCAQRCAYLPRVGRAWPPRSAASRAWWTRLRGGPRLGSPRPADPAALPLLAAAPACRARLPPCPARWSSRCRTSTTCSRTAVAATAFRASPATRLPPGSTWATRESPLPSPGPAGPSPKRPANPKAAVGVAAGAGQGLEVVASPGHSELGRRWSRLPPPRVGLGDWMPPRPVGSFPSLGARAQGPLGPASVLPGAATR